MEKNKILFGIVCFREKYWETQSFNDLINSYESFIRSDKELNIYIYDNTDRNDWIEPLLKSEKTLKISYYHNPKNEGISAAFNHFSFFANMNNFKWLVFLDQDTKLPIDFFEKYFYKSISSKPEKIIFPKIFSNNQLISPSKYVYYRTKPIDLENRKKIEINNITAINSGLMIETAFFLKAGGYNKRLRIDFCDHDFIARLNNKNIFAGLLNISLKQNFSAETDDKSKALARYRLYVKDLKVFKEKKNSLLIFFRVDFPHLLKMTYMYKTFEFLKIRFNIKQ